MTTIFGIPADQLQVNRQTVLDIVMIGPRGVGKTSVLASLYDQFAVVVGQTNLELRALGGTRGLLQQYREELGDFALGTRDSGEGISGTEGVVEHVFELGTKNIKTPQLRLRFTDINGELIAPAAGRVQDPGALAKLDAALQASSVVFVAIDSPALMERDGEFNERINKPKLVAEFVRDAAQGKPNLLVVLVPLKCEKYSDKKGMTALAAKVRESYGEMVMQLAGLRGLGAVWCSRRCRPSAPWSSPVTRATGRCSGCAARESARTRRRTLSSRCAGCCGSRPTAT